MTGLADTFAFSTYGFPAYVDVNPPSSPLLGWIWFNPASGVTQVYTPTGWVTVTASLAIQEIDLNTPGGANLGAAYTAWDAVAGNDITGGLVFATYGSPVQSYVLTDMSAPAVTTSWLSLGGGGGSADTQFAALADNAGGIGAAWAALATPPATAGNVTFASFQGDLYVLTTEATPATNASWTRMTTLLPAPGTGTGLRKLQASATGVVSWVADVANATVSATAPASPSSGQLWLDTNAVPSLLKIWDGAAWVLADRQPTISATAPTGIGTGNLWLDTSVTPNALRMWNGTVWLQVNQMVVAAAATAPTTPVTGQLYMDTSVTPNVLRMWNGTAWIAANSAAATVSATAPATPINGQLWLDTSLTPAVLKMWNGTTWLLADRQPVIASTAPATPGVGNLWLDTSLTPNQLKVWNGTVWQRVNSVTLDAAATAPATPATGQMYLDTSVTPPVVRIWNGTTWQLVDRQPIVAATAPATPGTGNLWLDTSVTPNLLKMWNGATWVIVPDVDSQFVDLGTTAADIGAAWTAFTPKPAVGGSTVTIASFKGGQYLLTTEATPGAAASWTFIGLGGLTTTLNALPRFAGTNGREIKNSGVIVSDANDVTGVNSIAVTANANHAVAASTGVMNLATAQMFTATAGAAITWSFTNVPTGRGVTVVLHLTNGGAFAQTWPGSVKWPSGTAPALTAAGTDVLVFVTHDGGTTWRGNIFGKDVK